MGKLSKIKKEEILQKNFPEFFKLAKDLSDSLEAVSQDLNEKLEKIYDIQNMADEIEEEKLNLDL